MGLSFPLPVILRPAPLRKRLWQGGVALAVLLGTLAIGNFFIAPDKAVTARTIGHDFLAFYTAGTLARTGEIQKLYSLPESRRFQHELRGAHHLEIADSFAPYWNPPFYAWLTAPLSMLSYHRALALWTGLNLACLAGAIIVMIRMLPVSAQRDRKVWGLVPLLVLTSMPLIQAVSHGQNTCMSLLLLSLVVTVWRKQMPVAAGLLCGLMFCKPQLALVVAGMLILTLGVRVCLGLGFVAGILLLITGVTMPNALGDYLDQLPMNLRFMQIENPYLWDRHVTVRAFWRLLYQGNAAGETSVLVNVLTGGCVMTIGAGLLLAWWRMKSRVLDDCWTGETRGVALDRVIVATIVSMPLLMPFYFDYDLLLLAVPAVLVGGESLMLGPGMKMDRMQRLLAGAWMGLYAWLLVNPLVARASGVNVGTMLLGAISGLAIARACGREARAMLLRLPGESPARMAA